MYQWESKHLKFCINLRLFIVTPHLTSFCKILNKFCWNCSEECYMKKRKKVNMATKGSQFQTRSEEKETLLITSQANRFWAELSKILLTLNSVHYDVTFGRKKKKKKFLWRVARFHEKGRRNERLQKKNYLMSPLKVIRTKL